MCYTSPNERQQTHVRKQRLVGEGKRRGHVIAEIIGRLNIPEIRKLFTFGKGGNVQASKRGTVWRYLDPER